MRGGSASAELAGLISGIDESWKFLQRQRRAAGQAPKLPIQAAAAYLAALRVPFILLCIFGVALGAYYFLHVSGARDYLTARNFRLLAKLGEQIDNTIENDRNVLIRLRKVLPIIIEGEERKRATSRTSCRFSVHPTSSTQTNISSRRIT